MSDPEGNSQFCFPESPYVSLDEVEGNIRTRGKKTNWFPEGLDIKCFFIFLDSNKRITGANQNSRLGIQQQKSNSQNLVKTTERMIYKVLSLYYLHLFPPLVVVSLLG